MVPPAGEMSIRDQSGTVLVRTYPGTVCGGLVPVGGGSRGRLEYTTQRETRLLSPVTVGL